MWRQADFHALIFLAVMSATISLAGCGAKSYDKTEMPADSRNAIMERTTDESEAGSDDETANGEANRRGVKTRAQDRKIIYNADIHIVVENFDGVDNEIQQLVAAHGGYLAETRIDRTMGDRRSGTWVARIPTTDYNAFTAAVLEIGTPERQQQTAEDVTDEFVDLQKRIENEKQLEQRILSLLEEKTGKISEVIEVERELARVRGEIERMEGRLQLLKNQTEFSTVTIQVREERDYTPPQAPTYGKQISRTWSGSIAALTQFGKNVLLVIVGGAPWLAVVLILAVPLFVVGRFLKRRKNRAER